MASMVASLALLVVFSPTAAQAAGEQAAPLQVHFRRQVLIGPGQMGAIAELPLEERPWAVPPEQARVVWRLARRGLESFLWQDETGTSFQVFPVPKIFLMRTRRWEARVDAKSGQAYVALPGGLGEEIESGFDFARISPETILPLVGNTEPLVRRVGDVEELIYQREREGADPVTVLRIWRRPGASSFLAAAVYSVEDGRLVRMVQRLEVVESTASAEEGGEVIVHRNFGPSQEPRSAFLYRILPWPEKAPSVESLFEKARAVYGRVYVRDRRIPPGVTYWANSLEDIPDDPRELVPDRHE